MDSYKDNLDTRCSSGEICKEYHRFQLRVMRMLSSLAERGNGSFKNGTPRPYDLRHAFAADFESRLPEYLRNALHPQVTVA